MPLVRQTLSPTRLAQQDEHVVDFQISHPASHAPSSKSDKTLFWKPPGRCASNRVQHQKGLSDDAFEQRYPDEEACRKAWFTWRWPEGFKCPRGAATPYCGLR